MWKDAHEETFFVRTNWYQMVIYDGTFLDGTYQKSLNEVLNVSQFMSKWIDLDVIRYISISKTYYKYAGFHDSIRNSL